MKKLLALFGLLFAFLLDAAGNPAQAQIANINDAINKAGSLRYTANRLAKVYFQLGMGIDVERSRRILDSAIAMYDRRVVELKNYAPTPEIKETYLTLEKAWGGYKDLLVGAKPNQEQADVTDVLLSVLLTKKTSGVADGVDYNDKNFLPTMPWLALPWQGYDQGHGKATP